MAIETETTPYLIQSKMTTTVTATTSTAITTVKNKMTTVGTNPGGFGTDPKSERSLDRVRDSVERYRV